MSTKFTRLNRESDPPAGKQASPTPQYWDRETERAEDVEGIKGAPGAVLFGPDGQPVSQANPLEVRVRELENKIDELKDLLTNGSQKTQLSGQIQEFAISDWSELDPDDVPIGSVAQLIGTDDIRQTDGQEWIRL